MIQQAPHYHTIFINVSLGSCRLTCSCPPLMLRALALGYKVPISVAYPSREIWPTPPLAVPNQYTGAYLASAMCGRRGVKGHNNYYWLCNWGVKGHYRLCIIAIRLYLFIGELKQTSVSTFIGTPVKHHYRRRRTRNRRGEGGREGRGGCGGGGGGGGGGHKSSVQAMLILCVHVLTLQCVLHHLLTQSLGDSCVPLHCGATVHLNLKISRG